MLSCYRAKLVKSFLERWFSKNKDAAEKLLELKLLETTKGNKKKELSLRKLEFFCTTYAQKHKVVFPHKTRHEMVNLCVDYAHVKEVFRKKGLDAFKRTKRQPFNINGKIVDSTLGQVNFFQWMFQTGAFDYAMANLEEIEREMKVWVKSKAPKTDKKKKTKKRTSKQVCFGPSKRPKLREAIILDLRTVSRTPETQFPSVVSSE